LSDNTAFHYVRGTGGSYDYAVVAVNGRVCLSIKIELVPAKPHGSFIALRLRSCPAPVELIPDGIPDAKPKAADFVAAWPALTFDKADDTRASGTAGTGVNRMLSQPQEIHDALVKANLWGKMATFLAGVVKAPGALVHPELVVRDLVKEMIEKKLAKHGSWQPFVLPAPEVDAVLSASDALKAFVAKHEPEVEAANALAKKIAELGQFHLEEDKPAPKPDPEPEGVSIKKAKKAKKPDDNECGEPVS
jgi:hypothetical protein